jgi:choline kinase
MEDEAYDNPFARHQRLEREDRHHAIGQNRRMTSAVVLAAGMGTRLSANVGRMKWLVEVGPTCPAEVQMGGIVAAGVEHVLVVTGPDADGLVERLDAWRSRVDIDLVANPRHRELNNWFSLLLGLRWLASTRRAEDVMVVNSDLFASPLWFEQAVRSLDAVTASAALVIDTVRPLTAEAMKVSSDERLARLQRVGKVGVDEPVGEYVGLARWSSNAAEELRAILEGYIDQATRADHWYEHAVDEHLRAGGDYELVRAPSDAWVEIDDDDDLAAARGLGVDAPPAFDAPTNGG